MNLARPPTLPNYLAIFAVSDLVQKRLFGSLEVPLFSFCTQGFQLFWWGTSLGLCRGDDLKTVAKALVGSEALGVAFESLGLPHQLAREKAQDEAWTLEYLGKVANDGLVHFGAEPDCLLNLFATSFSPPELDFRDITNMKRLAKAKLSVEDAIVQGSGWFLCGLSLGATHRKLAQRLGQSIYGHREAPWWLEYKQSGGIGPPFPEELEHATAVLGVNNVAEEIALSLLATYIQQYHPELMRPLEVEECLPSTLTGHGSLGARSSG